VILFFLGPLSKLVSSETVKYSFHPHSRGGTNQFSFIPEWVDISESHSSAVYVEGR